MKIGIVTTWFERGAAYVSRQFKQILEKEHDVYIYARGGEEYAIGDPNWDGDFVWWGKRKDSFFYKATYIDKKDFINWIQTKGIELIIFNEQQWFIPLIWCKELNIKTVAYIDYYTNATIPFFNIYDALICNTKRHTEAFENHPHAYYVPWGTDVELFKPTESKELVNGDVPTIFHSAGMSGYRKGTDQLLRAYLKSQQQCKLVLHTQRPLENQFPELVEAMNSLQKEGKLELITGTVTAPGLYYKGDIYIYPSRLEGIGLTIAEAISSGLVCIVPDNGPMNEFVDDSCGFAIPIKKYFCREDGYYWPMCEVDTDALASIIDKCSDSIDMVKSMKLQARRYALENLSQDSNFNMLLDIVTKVSLNPLDAILKSKIEKHFSGGLKRYDSIISRVVSFARKIKK